MEINHEIIFACDNGDIDIDIDEEFVRNRVKSINCVDEQNEFVRKLYKESTRRTNFVKKSYLANYSISPQNFLEDVRFIDGTKYRDKVDLFVGGSPCQSFSIMGEQKGLQDTRGTLFYDFARLVDEIKPKVFIFENVQGLLRHDKGNTWDTIYKVFESLNYNLFFDILDAKDFNIPQTRRRLFLIGFKEDIKDFKFPTEKKLEYTMQDFLETNVSFGNFTSTKNGLVLKKSQGEIDNKYFLSDKVLKHVMSPGTKNYYVEPEIDLKVARPLLATMHKMHRAGVDNYVTLNGKVRRLTPRECLRLMGYDDSFKQVVSDTQMYRQAGNSIVVDVMINLIQSILDTYPKLLD